MDRKDQKIWGCTLGNCIHIAGIYHFLQLAEECGYQTCFAGTGLAIETIIEVIKSEKPDYIALSYRLTPEVAVRILAELKERLKYIDLNGVRLIFGGTLPVCNEAAETGLFCAVFNGTESDEEVIQWLKGDLRPGSPKQWSGTLMDRIKSQAPYPVLRHHFGLPDLEATIAGVKTIAESKTLDIISIGPDQNAQEFFFRPEAMDHNHDGAGGVPLRKPEDLRRIYETSRSGNYPLLRIYSGTNDLLKWAELSVRELHNAWGAIPLYWYSVMDGRSKRSIQEAIGENQMAMAWYGKRNIPVEVNEAHHWSLRGAPDEVAVTAAYLAAYNAKAQGVSNFILQMMWNTPPQTLPYMDLAKMLAKLEMVESLADDDFHIWREVRAGLASLSPNANIAKGQLAASTSMALQVEPHIVHVVGFCEGDHAAAPAEIIESCQIVRGVIRNGITGLPEMASDSMVKFRKKQLLDKTYAILAKIHALHSRNALTDPEVLAMAVRNRILYAPQIIQEAL